MTGLICRWNNGQFILLPMDEKQAVKLVDDWAAGKFNQPCQKCNGEKCWECNQTGRRTVILKGVSELGDIKEWAIDTAGLVMIHTQKIDITPLAPNQRAIPARFGPGTSGGQF